MNKHSEKSIQCPECGADIEISEVLTRQIEQQLRSDYQQKQQQAIRQAVEEEREQQTAKSRLEIEDLQNQLKNNAEQLKITQQHELTLRQQARELEEKQQQFDLELQRRIDQEKTVLEKDVSQRITDELNQSHSLKLQEKQQQIESLRRSLEDARRKSEQGSQETQGEALETDIEDKLSVEFPYDAIESIAKGKRGADILQRVFNPQQQAAGNILWEVKNTKSWSPGWIEKLKDDQLESGANISILVSAVLPKDVISFSLREGVWICGIAYALPLASALREQLIQVHFSQLATQGKDEKMEMLFHYLSGDEFRHRVETLVNSFEAMQQQLNREKRAMERLWKEREKQIQRIITNTSGMYGEIRGIAGSSVPEIEALSLESDIENPVIAHNND